MKIQFDKDSIKRPEPVPGTLVRDPSGNFGFLYLDETKRGSPLRTMWFDPFYPGGGTFDSKRHEILPYGASVTLIQR